MLNLLSKMFKNQVSRILRPETQNESWVIERPNWVTFRVWLVFREDENYLRWTSKNWLKVMLISASWTWLQCCRFSRDFRSVFWLFSKRWKFSWKNQKEFLTEEWLKFGTGEGSIEQVVEKYDKLGFDANQDWPGNYQWEALYGRVELQQDSTGFQWLALWKPDLVPVYYISNVNPDKWHMSWR